MENDLAPREGNVEAFPFGLNDILARLQIPRKTLRAAFLLGSRLWGTGSPFSFIHVISFSMHIIITGLLCQEYSPLPGSSFSPVIST